MLLEQISLLRQSERPPISGKEFARLNHASFYADNSTMVEVLNSLYSELKEREANIPRARILLTGSTLAMGDYKVLDLVEATGGAVVVEEFAEGMRHYWEKVKPDGDLMERLADRYFRNRVPPAWFRPSRERIDFVLKLARDFSVDGIIWYQLMYRDSYDIQSFYFQKILEQETKIPMLKVQSDYDTSEIGPLRTRIETFIEVIEERG
jgi:benzoyl-CoA reductase/2-hydroxyglutaryl-CoA dehydratase subunit BcrC/BadD/HgdB